MKISNGFLALLLVTGFSAHAETDNFNVSLTGTFDNTVPDNCTVTPIATVDLGTLNMHDIKDNANSFVEGLNSLTAFETGATVDIIVNCTVGTSYEFNLDVHFNTAGLSVLFLHDGTDFLSPHASGVKLSSTGTGVNQTFTYNVLVSDNDSNDITTLTGALSATIPATLTVL